MPKINLSKRPTPAQTPAATPATETAPQLPPPPPPAPTRRPTLKIRNSSISIATPQSAGPPSATTLKLKGPKTLPKRPVQARALSIKVKGQVPQRPKGVGYDSEDSETERDPAIEQQFVLRMQPGEDADYLRAAIANRTIGLSIKEGGAEVSLRFIDKDFRRAVVTVRGRMYAAVLVDLPCVVETHKSWDKRGWWKVADISQMLLVLDRCTGDEEARNVPLPREVNPQNLQYAHGLTPPMHWVRKRRFRKRMSYQTIEHVEEEVEKLLKEDEQIEKLRGNVKYETLTRAQYERAQNASQEPPSDYDDDMADADGEAVDALEDGQQQAYDEMADEEDDMLEAELKAAMEMDGPESQVPPPSATELVQSPAAMLDRAGTFAAAEASVASTPAPETPAAETGTEQTSDDEEEDDDDEDEEEDESDEDEDSPDVVDEDAAARAAERAQQIEEVADLEKELEYARNKMAAMKNQLLRTRQIQSIQQLEEDLRVKRRMFGLDQDE